MITIGYLMLLGLLYISTGLISSGYHMMEDHEIMANHDLFQKMDVWSYFTTVWNDSGNRISRGLQLYLALFSALFGSNWWMWHSFVLVTLALALTELNFIGNRLGLNRWTAFTIPILLIAGSATEILTRLATIEAVSVLLGAWLIHRILNRRLGYSTLMIVFLLFFTKESFVLLGPFIIAFAYWSTSRNEQDAKEHLNPQLIQFFGGVGLITALFALAFFVNDVSNTEADYVLAKPETFIATIQTYFHHVFSENWWETTPITCLLFLCVVLFFLVRQITFPTVVLAFFGLVTILVQFLLLVSVGFSGRYLIPTLLVVFILIAVFMSMFRDNSMRQSIFFALFLVVSVPQGLHSSRIIKQYVESGNAIRKAVLLSGAHCSNTCTVLLVGDPLLNMEMFQAVITYLKLERPEKDYQVKILPTEVNIEGFMELAEIYDYHSIERFKQGFEQHYDERLAEHCDTSYSIIIGIGDETDLFSHCSKEHFSIVEKSFGQEWYTFTIATCK